jgi:hypothetical protein
MSEAIKKSRNIPMTDLFEILQYEFLSYYFRFKLYMRQEDKEKFEKYCKQKRDTIEKLCTRHGLYSIFTKEEKKKKYLDQFIGQSGLPNFTYRDDYQKSVLGYWDKIYYFPVESKVVWLVNPELNAVVNRNLCKRDETALDLLIIRDIDTNETHKVLMSDCKRVLEDEFLSLNFI